MFITKEKQNTIRKHYIAGNLKVKNIANVMGLQCKTVRYYLNEFRVIESKYPDKLHDYAFFASREIVTRASQWHQNMMHVVPTLVANEPGPVLVASELYRKYFKIFPNEYKLAAFTRFFYKWFGENRKKICEARLREKFSEEDLETLKVWRKSNDHRLWQIAIVLTESTYTYHTNKEVAKRADCTYVTMLRWLRTYEKSGLKGVLESGKKRPLKEEEVQQIETKKDNLIHLIQQSPGIYGIDRVSWKLEDLATVFRREYGGTMTISTVSNYLKERGVRYRRSREVISSPDPLFRQKYSNIQSILENLGKDEKFFSIDEYGPRAVRPKGGRMLTLPGEQPIFKGMEKSKGWFICTAAIELSTNQITHFYSVSKETDEMIKLIEVLVDKYKDQKTLYLSWDAASWHSSKQLMKYLEKINDSQYRAKNERPFIVLAPLPARAPHMNIIESVFSGMSKAVIRNSDYASLTDCKAAIDRYFARRNAHFLENPKRAGDKIWGKERVKPVFKKALICKKL